jgi:hypothetical protein
MIILEVKHNGNIVARAGRSDLSVLNTIVDAICVLGESSVGTKTEKEGFYLHLHVGGLSVSSEEDPGNHLRWVSSKQISVGDEVNIRILEGNDPDPPAKEKPGDKKEHLKHQREAWESAKKYYLKYKDKYEKEGC